MVIANEVLLANATLNALASRIAVLDGHGVIVFVNDAWCRSARERGAADGDDCDLGANYLAVCRAASREGDEWARLALDGLEGILKGHRDEFSFEYPCSTPDREVWFSVKEIVAIHHRTIEAASAGEHGGATFTIRLPACR